MTIIKFVNNFLNNGNTDHFLDCKPFLEFVILKILIALIEIITTLFFFFLILKIGKVYWKCVKIVSSAVTGKNNGEVCLMVRNVEIGEMDFLTVASICLFVIL